LFKTSLPTLLEVRWGFGWTK